MITRTWQREIRNEQIREKQAAMTGRDECAVMGCDLLRKPAPRSPRFKRSKYCIDHALIAKLKFQGSYDADALLDLDPRI